MTQPGTGTKRFSAVSEITGLAVWEMLSRSANDRREWLDRTHIELTEIPAPTFREAARAQYCANKFRELGLPRVHVDDVGNVLAERPGLDANCIALTAHLDTVLPPGIPVEVKRLDGLLCAPGISDNGAGLATLLGAAALLSESSIVTGLSLLFVANVGEEGEGDLAGVRHLFSTRDMCRRTKGVIVLDGSSVQQTATAGLGSRRFLVEIAGPGGHSWSDFGRVNPIHALASAIATLRGIRLPDDPRTSLNIGLIHGGTAVNAIPQSAWMKIDIRSTNPEEIERLSGEMETAVRNAVDAEQRVSCGKLESRITMIGNRPAAELPHSARIRQVIRDVDRHLGIRGRFETSSTDANIPLSLGIEAIATGGGGTGGDAHTENEWYDPQGRELGLKRIMLAALALAGVVEERSPSQ